MTKAPDYGDQFHECYDRGRTLPDESLDRWMRSLDHHLGGRHGLVVVDVGSGTGRFSFPLAEWFEATIIGVEPSDKMRAVALAKESDTRVRFVAGSAAALPVADASADAAVLSMVVHHIPDLAAAARELDRVLKPGGLVFIRNAFRGRLDQVPWYEWFPEAKAADEARMPSVEDVVDSLGALGLEEVTLEAVPQVLALTFANFVENIGHRAISTQQLISDEAFEAGMGRMRAAAVHIRNADPVVENIDLLVLRKG